MPTVILAGTYDDNYLTLGDRTFHVPPEAIAAAEAAFAAAQVNEPAAPAAEDPPASSRKRSKPVEA